MERMW